MQLLSIMQGKKIKFLATTQKCWIQESVLTDRLMHLMTQI